MPHVIDPPLNGQEVLTKFKRSESWSSKFCFTTYFPTPFVSSQHPPPETKYKFKTPNKLGKRKKERKLETSI